MARKKNPKRPRAPARVPLWVRWATSGLLCLFWLVGLSWYSAGWFALRCDGYRCEATEHTLLWHRTEGFLRAGARVVMEHNRRNEWLRITDARGRSFQLPERRDTYPMRTLLPEAERALATGTGGFAQVPMFSFWLFHVLAGLTVLASLPFDRWRTQPQEPQRSER